MKRKRKNRQGIAFLLIASSLFLFINLKGTKNMIAGISDTQEKNIYVEIVKAIDEVYTEGTIKIIFCSEDDSMENIVNEKVDFHIPHMEDPGVRIQKRPYHYTSEKLGKISVVIYSNVKKPLTSKMLDKANKDLDNGKPFPYKIDISSNIEYYMTFKVNPVKNFSQSLKKVENKTIDAVMWIQEEGDEALTKLKTKSIHRENWFDYNNSLLVASTQAGDEIDEILSAAIKKLKKSGKLNQLYSKLHGPYKNWQPSKMDW